MNFRSSRPPDGPKGVLIAIATVLGLTIFAFVVAFLLHMVVSNLVPSAGVLRWLGEPWMVLIWGMLVLAGVLVFAVRALPWLSNWYYILPALVFVLVFTVYPIILTFYLAFTNYSGKNSGRPDASTQLKLLRVSDHELRVTDGSLSDLKCELASCKGQLVELRENELTGKPGPIYKIANIGDKKIVLEKSLAGFQPTLLRKVNPYKFIGFENFKNIFAQASVQLIPVFVWNLIFAASTTVLNILAGLILGILLNNKRLKFRNFYRSVLILPWAMPAVISVLMWKTLLNQNFGALNRLMGLFGFLPAPWLTDSYWAKAGILLINLWLGFPYMMTTTIAALSTIPEELYEAASIDGATRWHAVRFITLPNLVAAFTPIALGTFAYNFNNFILIYMLFKEGEGPIEPGQLSAANSVDILMSWGYKTAFTYAGDQAYGIGSAISIIIGILTVLIAIVNFSAAGVFKEARR